MFRKSGIEENFNWNKLSSWTEVKQGGIEIWKIRFPLFQNRARIDICTGIELRMTLFTLLSIAEVAHLSLYSLISPPFFLHATRLENSPPRLILRCISGLLFPQKKKKKFWPSYPRLEIQCRQTTMLIFRSRSIFRAVPFTGFKLFLHLKI